MQVIQSREDETISHIDMFLRAGQDKSRQLITAYDDDASCTDPLTHKVSQ